MSINGLGQATPRPSVAGSDRPSRRSALKPQATRELCVAAVPGVLEFKGVNMSERVRSMLRQFDVTEDDQLDVNEVTALVEHLIQQERQNVQLRWTVLLLVVFTCLLLAGTFGLTWAVVAALKDTKVDKDNGVLTVKGDNSKVVQVSSNEYKVSGGVFEDRAGTFTVGNATVNNPVRAAQYKGVRLNYSPLLGYETLMEMSYLVVKAGQGFNASELLVRVDAVAILLDFNARWGSVIKIVTPLGSISLYDSNDIRFDTDTARIFEDMGLTTANLTSSSGQRRLLQQDSTAAAADALFNTVDEDSVIDPTVHNYQGMGPDKSNGGVKNKARRCQRVINTADSGNVAGEAALMASWSDWKRSYYQGLDSEAIALEENRPEGDRYTSFKQNLRQVIQLNNDDSKGWVSTGNAFMDTPVQELQQLHKLEDNARTFAAALNDPRNKEGMETTAQASVVTGNRHLLQAAVKPPTYVNWYDEGKVTAVRTQGACGCCYAFSAVAVVESAFLIAFNKGPSDVRLSYAQAAFCCRNTTSAGLGACFNAFGCGGGDAGEVINYAWKALLAHQCSSHSNHLMGDGWLQSGLSDEVTTWNANRLLWGQGVTMPCDTQVFPGNRSQPTQKYLKLNQGAIWRGAGTSESALMAMVNDAPVVAYMEVTPDLYFFGAGVYDGPCGTDVNHAIVIIGYDRRAVVPYWIIKNTWGTTWGGPATTTTGLSGTISKGYLWLRMMGDGQGKCGLHRFVYQVKRSFNVTYGITVNTTANASTQALGGGNSSRLLF